MPALGWPLDDVHEYQDRTYPEWHRWVWQALLYSLIFVAPISILLPSTSFSPTEEQGTISKPAGKSRWQRCPGCLFPSPEETRKERSPILLPCAMNPRLGEPPGHPVSYASNGYLTVAVRGGMNQQRKGIVNAVLLAYLLNATLVVPEFEQHAFWQQTLQFGDLFDVDTFIAGVQYDVRVIKSLPKQLKNVTPASIWLDDRSSLVDERQMVDLFLGPLLSVGVVRVTGWHVQPQEVLAPHLQRVRCRANFHALVFVPRIQRLANALVTELRRTGPYAAVHMRFEADWLYHRGCQLNETSLRTYMYRRPGEPGYKEACPLTPGELASLLKLIGVTAARPVFLAGSAIEFAPVEAPFLTQFPLSVRRDSLMNLLLEQGKLDLLGEKLKPLDGAAIDHIIATESDIMVEADSESNWGHVVAGERFYRFKKGQRTLLLTVNELKPLVEQGEGQEGDLTTRLHLMEMDFRQRGCVDRLGLSTCSPLDCVCEESLCRPP
eukprot:TRINITY_DN3565_c0_g1_i1.p1 TRINITY_DN3565_c0_g1~~TRINITY_DN3565_c0_g1_i1.p1  ORF type:complete len:493 (-),score=46.75 TRINITY_DN3565_c0_g1_i1:343-1821(-)